MSIRTRIRNWLLKPSSAELTDTNGQGKVVAELLWGHVSREMKRDVVRTLGADATAGGVAFSEGMPVGTLAFEQGGAPVRDLGEVDSEKLA